MTDQDFDGVIDIACNVLVRNGGPTRWSVQWVREQVVFQCVHTGGETGGETGGWSGGWAGGWDIHRSWVRGSGPLNG